MKLNKIMALFFLALPASIGLRFLQLYFTIDAKTGFYVNEAGNYGQIILLLILLCATTVGIFCSLTFSKPEGPPKPNIFMSVTSTLLSLAIICEFIFKPTLISVPIWQNVLLKLSGITMIAYFIIFAIAYFKQLELPKIISIIPVVYFIIRIICDFTSISKLAMISDNILLVIAYCTILLFFLNYAKLYNGVENENCFKRLLGYGLASVVLCFVNSVPNIFINLITKGGYLHTSIFTSISVFFVGLFILSFSLSYFSKKNI